MKRDFIYSQLKPITPGCGYGRYIGVRLREQGRKLFREAVQSHWSDLGDDPWDTGESRERDD
jgi:hypothetical protein